MAARKTSTRTLRILRTVLLVSLVGILALVYALYRFGRAGLPDDDSRGTRADESRSTDKSAVMEAQGFDYSITQGSETLARIRAQRVVSQQENEVTLEQIDPIEVYRSDGSIYSVSSAAGTYNFDTQATRLEGNVILRGPRDMELRTDGLSMGQTHQVVNSLSAVTFNMAGEFVGQARQLRADLDRDLFVLTGNVRIRTTNPGREPAALRCNRLTLDRETGVVRAEGNARFYSGENYLESERIVFQLTEDERQIEYVSGRWGLKARQVKRFGHRQLTRTTTIEADQFSLRLDPGTGDPVEAEIVATREATTQLTTTDETGLARELTAPVIHARFSDGELRRAESSGHVQVREFLTFAPGQTLRWACGEQVVVDFDAAGEIRQAEFLDRVEFRQGRSIAKADRLELTGETQTIEMVGSPARLISAQGELTAPKITQIGEDGDAHATGGVRGRFEPEGASSISIGGGKGPIRVESAEARWNQATPSFRFEQSVRLWQGENLLLAQEVETLTDEDLVVARGGVRTILTPEPEEDDGDPEEEGEASVAAREPAEIVSEWMEYGTETRLITYHDNVEIRQAGRLMTCDRAEAELADGGGLRAMNCLGNARIEDNIAGRTVSGVDAFYRVGQGQITFKGNARTPVVMTGEQGERIEGATLVYDLGSGAARVERGTGTPPPPPAADDDGDHGADETDSGGQGDL
jgi:lipopolysaccharide export system protein LptA